VFTRCV